MAGFLAIPAHPGLGKINGLGGRSREGGARKSEGPALGPRVNTNLRFVVALFYALIRKLSAKPVFDVALHRRRYFDCNSDTAYYFGGGFESM